MLNGEPFTRPCLRSLYTFAHEIIVVEGGSRYAAEFCTPDGHSTDGTLAALREFKATEDPDDKLKIVTRDSFWDEKKQQSQAYAERATGDWLWQVDIDEFYRPEGLQRVGQMLAAAPEIEAVSFPTITFWARPEYEVDGLALRAGGQEFHRLFKWGPGFRYVAHRPPTVVNTQGLNLRQGCWLRGGEMRRHDVYLYHYALMFPRQVRQKVGYYQSLYPTAAGLAAWAEAAYFSLQRPFRVHNRYRHLSWLQPCAWPHPPEIGRLFAELSAGRLGEALRPCADAEQLLKSPAYCRRRQGLARLAPLYGALLRLWERRPAYLIPPRLRAVLNR